MVRTAEIPPILVLAAPAIHPNTPVGGQTPARIAPSRRKSRKGGDRRRRLDPRVLTPFRAASRVPVARRPGALEGPRPCGGDQAPIAATTTSPPSALHERQREPTPGLWRLSSASAEPSLLAVHGGLGDLHQAGDRAPVIRPARGSRADGDGPVLASPEPKDGHPQPLKDRARATGVGLGQEDHQLVTAGA